MIRRIIFRGKVKGEPNWVYGSLLNIDCFSTIIDEFGYSIAVECYTVGQFIGLNDKNGKEIYEDDIIVNPSCGTIGVICFSKGIFGIKWNDKELLLASGGLRRFNDGFNSKIEVIGNIHDNPELLEQK